MGPATETAAALIKEHAPIGSTNMTISVQPDTEVWIEYDSEVFENVSLESRSVLQVHFVTPLLFERPIRLLGRMAKYRCVLRPAKYADLAMSSYPKVATPKLKRAVHAAILKALKRKSTDGEERLKFGANGVTATYKKRTYYCEVTEIE